MKRSWWSSGMDGLMGGGIPTTWRLTRAAGQTALALLEALDLLQEVHVLGAGVQQLVEGQVVRVHGAVVVRAGVGSQVLAAR